MADSTTPDPGDGDFFDDDNNKAMYLVLPAMILIYGSCCLVYCVHKCRRYCIHQKKKMRKKEENIKLMGKQNKSFDNPTLILHDEHPNMSSRSGTSRNPTVILTLENLENDHSQTTVGTPRKSQETDVDSLEDVLQAETVSGGVSPGYAGATLSQEMQHLDNQLKAAFRLTNAEEGKLSSQQEQQQQKKKIQPQQGNQELVIQPQNNHEAITAYINWKTLQKTAPPKLEVKYTATGDTIVVRIPKEKRLQMVQKTDSAVHPQEEDIATMMDLRQKINKDMPKSMPDILKKQDENVVTLKKMSMNAKKRIYLSTQ